MIINGYNIDESSKRSCRSGERYSATRGGAKYSIKKLSDPKRPSPRLSESVRAIKEKDCSAFEQERKRIVYDLKLYRGCNIIPPVEYFVDKLCYYEASEWVDIKPMTLAEVAALPEEDKLLILKTAAGNLNNVHSKGIIHLDIKYDNMPISVSPVTRNVVSSLLDFTSSHYADTLPEPDATEVTPPYMSPELAAYKTFNPKYGGKSAISVKSDVFALAIVFHEYWTGRKFIFRDSDKPGLARMLYQAVDAGDPISVAEGVPAWLEALLKWMIARNPDDRPTMNQVLMGLKNHATIKGYDSSVEPEPAVKPADRKTRSDKPRDVVEWFRREYAPAIKSDRVSTSAVGYKKGPNWPDHYTNFEVKNGRIIFIFRSGARTNLDCSTALRKGYIAKA